MKNLSGPWVKVGPSTRMETVLGSRSVKQAATRLSWSGPQVVFAVVL
jgi:hypothetical protein